MNIRRYVLPLATLSRRLKYLSTQSLNTIPFPPLPKQNPPQPTAPSPRNPNAAGTEFSLICDVLLNPVLHPGSELEDALTRTEVNPSSELLLQVFKHFDSSAKPLFTLFKWTQKRPDYQFSMPIFNAMVNSLGKAREFDSAWCLILDQIEGNPSERPDFDTFVILIRRYSRAGLPLAAIRTFEYANSLNFFQDSYPGNSLLESLLDTLCKEGHVRIASKYCDKQRAKDPSWLPSVRMYNILMNGWLRIGKLRHADRVREQMKKDDVHPNVVTYGTLVEGLCRMRRPDMAMELLNEMKMEGVKPNAIIYNAIIDALGEAGRFKEALGMLERFSILELGPTIYTYNSLVKGFCKAGDIAGASKIIKMMIDDKCFPISTTYNYFFKYFLKAGKTEVALDLYNRMARCGYELDRLTYHMLVKELCKEGRLDLTTQIIKEMRDRGIDLDLAGSTMLIHLLWKMHRYDDAVFEFQDMFRRGIVPQHLTYRRMSDELERRGMSRTAQKLHDLMQSVPHSTKLPNTYGGSKISYERKKSILKKAESISEMLKTCKDPKELIKNRHQPENVLVSAHKLIDHIQRKANFRENVSIQCLSTNCYDAEVTTLTVSHEKLERPLSKMASQRGIDGRKPGKYIGIVKLSRF